MGPQQQQLLLKSAIEEAYGLKFEEKTYGDNYDEKSGGLVTRYHLVKPYFHWEGWYVIFPRIEHTPELKKPQININQRNSKEEYDGALRFVKIRKVNRTDL